jgi:hypothetical protein
VAAGPHRERDGGADAVELGASGKAPVGELLVEEEVSLTDEPAVVGVAEVVTEHLEHVLDGAACRHTAIDAYPRTSGRRA